MLMLGGLLGFGIGILFGLARSGSWQDVIWKSALCAYIAGKLMKWWGNVWINCIKESASNQTRHQQSPREATAKSDL